MAISSNIYTDITVAKTDDIVVTTLLNYRRQLIDNFFNRQVFFFMLREKGAVRMEDGGERIVEHLGATDNLTTANYAGFDTIDTTPQETFKIALYEWKQYASSITISRREERQNSGRHRIINLLQARINWAEESIRNKINTDLFATSQANKAIGSLDFIANTGALGQITGTDSDSGFWQGTVTASGSFAGQGLSDMRTLYNTLSSSSGVDAPNMVITTQSVFEFYEGELQPQMRFSDERLADGGFVSLTYKGNPFVFDKACTTGRLYMLNLDFLSLVIDRASNFVPSPFVRPANQDARTSQLLFMGELTTNNRRRQGKLTGITA